MEALDRLKASSPCQCIWMSDEPPSISLLGEDHCKLSPHLWLVSIAFRGGTVWTRTSDRASTAKYALQTF